MRRLLCLAALLLLAACQAKPGPAPAANGTPAAGAPSVVAPTLAATALPPQPPAPTSLADGLVVRLGTPDASPDCPAHYPWFFENRARECAGTVLNTGTVLQRFERGLMVWTQEGGHTYVLLDDGSLFKPYQEVSDPTGAELAGPDPSIVPPAGLYQPVLGFARFWRGLAPGSDWVRAALGWATAPEQSYSAFWQCNTAAGAAARCYFNGPRDEIIVLSRGGVDYWNYWQGPVR
jgi:hypothetical protein